MIRSGNHHFRIEGYQIKGNLNILLEQDHQLAQCQFQKAS